MRNSFVPKMVLDNLRRNVNRVGEEILGEGFYDYSQDIIIADREMCEDIIAEHKRLKRENVCLLVFCYVLLFVVMLLYGYIRWH